MFQDRGFNDFNRKTLCKYKLYLSPNIKVKIVLETNKLLKVKSSLPKEIKPYHSSHLL